MAAFDAVVLRSRCRISLQSALTCSEPSSTLCRFCKLNLWTCRQRRCCEPYRPVIGTRLALPSRAPSQPPRSLREVKHRMLGRMSNQTSPHMPGTSGKSGPPETCPKCGTTSSPWLESFGFGMQCSYYRYPGCGHSIEVDNEPIDAARPAQGGQRAPKQTPPWWTQGG
jgi:hypothetical protein